VPAGACASYLRFDRKEQRDLEYRERLREAGIEKLLLGGLWPSPDVTPESLGRKGWDGNVAIEWIAEQLAIKRSRSEP
jgi:hypothetical protein